MILISNMAWLSFAKYLLFLSLLNFSVLLEVEELNAKLIKNDFTLSEVENEIASFTSLGVSVIPSLLASAKTHQDVLLIAFYDFNLTEGISSKIPSELKNSQDGGLEFILIGKLLDEVAVAYLISEFTHAPNSPNYLIGYRWLLAELISRYAFSKNIENFKVSFSDDEKTKLEMRQNFKKLTNFEPKLIYPNIQLWSFIKKALGCNSDFLSPLLQNTKEPTNSNNR